MTNTRGMKRLKVWYNNVTAIACFPKRSITPSNQNLNPNRESRIVESQKAAHTHSPVNTDEKAIKTQLMNHTTITTMRKEEHHVDLAPIYI